MDVLNTVSGDEVSGTAHGDSLQDSLTKHCAFDLDILNIIREFDEKTSIKVCLSATPAIPHDLPRNPDAPVGQVCVRDGEIESEYVCVHLSMYIHTQHTAFGCKLILGSSHVHA